MDPSQITDQKSLEAWLQGQTREVAVTIAHRAAMRVAPEFWCRVPPVSQAVHFTALCAARPLLIAGVAGSCPSLEIKHRGAAAANANWGDDAQLAIHDIENSAAEAIDAATAAGIAIDAGGGTATAAAGAMSTAGRAGGDAARPAILDAIRHDAHILDRQTTGKAAVATPIWPTGGAPFDEAWQRIRAAWDAQNDPGWRFWIDWYDAALEGRPLLGDWDRHWALLNEIALIDPEDWDAGPESVNPLIEEKFEKQRLRAEVADLKAKLAEQENTVASVAHRSHNHPPEMVEASLDSLYLVTLDALADAEDELSKASPSPSPSRLNACAAALLDWAGIVVSYSGELGDLIVKGAARKAGASIGLAAGPAALFWTSEQARQVAQALIDFAQRLP